MLLHTCQTTINLRICWILRRGCQALTVCLYTHSLPLLPLTLSGTTVPSPHLVKVRCSDFTLFASPPVTLPLFPIDIIYCFSDFFYKLICFEYTRIAVHNKIFPSVFLETCGYTIIFFHSFHLTPQSTMSQCFFQLLLLVPHIPQVSLSIFITVVFSDLISLSLFPSY